MMMVAILDYLRLVVNAEEQARLFVAVFESHLLQMAAIHSQNALCRV